MMSLHQASTMVVRRTAQRMAAKALAARGGVCRSTHSSSVRDIHSIDRLASTVSAVRAGRSSNFKAGSIDIAKLFDKVDSDSDGYINKSEFLAALKLVKYDGILKTQADAKDELNRLSKKMETLERLEKDMVDLEESYTLQQKVCNTQDMMMESEVQDMFAASDLKKDSIRKAINELRNQIFESRATFNSMAKAQQY
jgi:Ca2+-binding EF-hand superfamily protein